MHLIYILVGAYISVVAIVVVWTVLFNREKFIGTRAHHRGSTPPPVYCLMVTRNDAHRRPFARASVRNFREQRYPRKHLVILNQSTPPLSDGGADITEIMVPRPHAMTLGQLRNMSLSWVPHDALWTTWDDDDWRREDYLATLSRELRRGDYDLIAIDTRIEYNAHTGFAHVATLRSGFPSTFFARKHPMLAYDPQLHTLEDVPVKQYAMRHLRYRVAALPATMYVRMSHGANTSPYVDPRKRAVRDTSMNADYFEADITAEQKAYLRDVLSQKYAGAPVKNVT